MTTNSEDPKTPAEQLAWLLSANAGDSVLFSAEEFQSLDTAPHVEEGTLRVENWDGGERFRVIKEYIPEPDPEADVAEQPAD